MKKGVFIVIDGLGGSGKTTQIELLKKHLPADTVFTHEPGGAPRAEKIRTMLKEADDRTIDPLADFFLFWAARAEHMTARIRPALEAGRTVLSDRFDSSTFAMQVRGDERPDLENLFWECRKVVLGELVPDAYIILDINPDQAHTRRDARGRPKGEDRFDERAESYQRRVSEGYKEFATRMNGHVVESGRPPEEVDKDLWKIIEPLL
jgi:dTMP kinase